MAQKIQITATDGSQLEIEVMGVLSQGDLEDEREALALARMEAEQAKLKYESAMASALDLTALTIQLEIAKNEILDAMPKECTDEDIQSIFDDSESVSVSESIISELEDSESVSVSESESVSESVSECVASPQEEQR